VTLPLSYSRSIHTTFELRGPSLHSGSRRRAQTPAKRLDLEGCDSTTELLPLNQLSVLGRQLNAVATEINKLPNFWSR
jgi:hypothetical protein